MSIHPNFVRENSNVNFTAHNRSKLTFFSSKAIIPVYTFLFMLVWVNIFYLQDNNPKESSLFGKWRLVDDNGVKITNNSKKQTYFIFNKNKSAEILYQKGKEKRSQLGTWDYSIQNGKNIFFLTMPKSEPKGEIGVRFNKDTLVIFSYGA